MKGRGIAWLQSGTLSGVPGIAMLSSCYCWQFVGENELTKAIGTYRARSHRAMCREGDTNPDTVSTVARDLNNGNGVTRVVRLQRRLTHAAPPRHLTIMRHGFASFQNSGISSNGKKPRDK